MQVQSLSREDSLKEGMATHSSRQNPMDRRAWQATVHRITKSQIQLKQLSPAAHTEQESPKIHEAKTDGTKEKKRQLSNS